MVCGAVSLGKGYVVLCLGKGVRPICIPELSRELNPLKDLIAFVKICRIIKAEKPDIIHTHTAKAGALGRIAGIYYNCLVRLPACRQGRLRPFGARNDAVKLIHTFHGHVFEGYFNRLFRCIFILIERCLAYFTCRVITVSESVKNELAGLGICQAEKIQVIPLGFELEKFLGVAPRNKGRNCKYRDCGQVGAGEEPPSIPGSGGEHS